MADYSYDVLVIGAGPSGEGVAMGAAKNGMRVGVVESRQWIGGNCIHKGTIPSKSIRHVVKEIMSYRKNNIFHQMGDMHTVTFPEVLKEAKRIIPRQVDVHSGFYLKNRIRLHTGLARFVDKHQVEVDTPEGSTETIKAKHIVLATGSRPYRPEDR